MLKLDYNVLNRLLSVKLGATSYFTKPIKD